MASRRKCKKETERGGERRERERERERERGVSARNAAPAS